MKIILENINDSNQEQAIRQVQCCMISLFDFIGSNKASHSSSRNKKQNRRVTTTESSYVYEIPDVSDLTIKVNSKDMTEFTCSVVNTEDG